MFVVATINLLRQSCRIERLNPVTQASHRPMPRHPCTHKTDGGAVSARRRTRRSSPVLFWYRSLSLSASARSLPAAIFSADVVCHGLSDNNQGVPLLSDVPVRERPSLLPPPQQSEHAVDGPDADSEVHPVPPREPAGRRQALLRGHQPVHTGPRATQSQLGGVAKALRGRIRRRWEDGMKTR